jgi:hypothetical protein
MKEQYEMDGFGVIHQLNAQPFNYDEAYIGTYKNYGPTQDMLSHLRLGYLRGAMQRKPKSILDVGYGSGNFLKICQEADIECYGSDISGVPVPEGCKFVEDFIKCGMEFDAIAMFDSLEHFENMDFVKNLKVNYIIISVPCIPTRNFNSAEFINWKHRKPNEHLHHFDELSLISFMASVGYKRISVGNPEDVIRKNYNVEKNIITGVFRKL